MQWREIHWPRPLDVGNALGFLTGLASDTARGSLIWEVRTEVSRTRYLLGGERLDVSSTVSMLRRLLPDVAITELVEPRAEVERAGRVSVRQRNLGLTLDARPETLRAVLAALAGARSTGDVLALQVVMGRAASPELVPAQTTDPSTSLLDLLSTGPKQASAEVRSRLQSKLAQYRFRAVVRVGVSSPSPVRRRLLVHSMLAALRTLQASGTRIELTSKNPANLDAGLIPLRQPLRLTPEEILTVLAWPVGEKDLPGLPSAHPRLIAPPKNYQAPEQRVFATTTAPGSTASIGIRIDDALRHTHLYGPTGAGKSTLLLHLIAADIAAGRSVVVIDPKRDLAMDVLALIPNARRQHVALIDPSLPEPAGINPFVGFDRPGADARRPLVADIMLDLFKGLFPSAFGPLTSDTLHASFLTLTYAQDASLARLPQLLTDAKYRHTVLAQVNDPTLLGFWEQYDAKSAGQQANAVGPVMTRLRQFLLRAGVRAVLEQAHPRFALEDLFTKPRILIVSLNKGLLGSQTASLLGSLVVAQLWQLILARAAVPEKARTPVSIYIDEAQNFLHLGDLGEALEQSRSLGAAWHLAHQFRAQMPDKLLRSIDANARNKIIFGLEDDEARTAAKTTGLDADDFTRLPPYEIYASLQNNGRRTGWFSARVLAPPKAISSAEAIIAESQARYGSAPAPHNRETVNASLATVQLDEDEPIGRTKRNPK